MVAKKTAKKKVEKNKIKEEAEKTKPTRYFYAVGRRKTSIAQVRIYPEEKATEADFLVNGKKVKEYFPSLSLQNGIFAPLKAAGFQNGFRISVLVKGGGFNGQAGAVKMGIARALVEYNKELRKTLKVLGFLTRDSRMVERKKPGLKKARRAPQWQKR